MVVDFRLLSPWQRGSVLAIALNMIYLFVVLIVLLNILIAQLSDTYADVKSDAQSTLEQNWAQALRNIDQTDKMKVSELGWMR